MAVERGYEQQVRPGQTAGLPRAGAEAFGAGIGDALVGMGRAIARDDDERDNEELAAKSVELEQIKVEIEKDERDGRDPLNPNAPRGGVGYAEGVTKRAGERFDAFLGGIQGKRVRENFMGRIAAYRGDLAARTEGYEIGARAKQLGADTKDYRTALTNRGIQNGGLDEILFDYEDHVTNGIVGSDDVKQALLREGLPEIKADFGLAIAGTDPAKAKALARSNLYADVDPAVNERIINAADAELLARKHADDKNLELIRRGMREDIATVKARVSVGEDVPDADFARVEGLARQLGDQSTAVEMRGARIAALVNKETRPWSAQDYASNIQQLRALGEKRTPEQDIRLKHLEQIAPGRIAELRNDAGSWASLNGVPPPALNRADPASWAARRRWQAQVSATTGVPTPFLQKEEVADLQARYGAGAKARLEVINEIAPYGQSAMRQVAPGDDMAQRLVLLRPGDRADALNGVEARKANRELVDKAGAGGSADLTDKQFRARVGPAAKLLGQGDYTASLEIARNLYADWATKSGRQGFDAGMFGVFIHRALGGTKDAQGAYHGGVGVWNDKPVLLPPRLSQAQFDATLRGLKFASGAPVPVWHDGSPMTPNDLRKLTPVARPDGWYQFEFNGVPVTVKGAGVWRLDIGALHRKLGR